LLDSAPNVLILLIVQCFVCTAEKDES
jgi:hypothetical protein